MLIANPCYEEMINAPARTIKGRVELLDGSTLLDTFSYDNHLKSFTIERAGDTSKFFGYGICQKLKVELVDHHRELNITKGLQMEVVIGVGCEYLYTCPVFFVDEVTRDENTNMLTVVAYDALTRAAAHTVSELSVFGASYTIAAFVASCGLLLGMPIKYENVIEDLFSTYYEGGANFSGNETIRQALDAVAEVTQTVYYMNNNWELTFKRLDMDGEPVLTIDKSKYFTLSSKDNVTLSAIEHQTDLGDNVIAKSERFEGSTQFIRDNPFWNMRDDIDVLINYALDAVEGLTINQFDCSWRGNFLLEIGDKIAFVTKDNAIVHSYLLNDALTYSGGLGESTQWHFTNSESEQATGNPSTIGAAISQTYAKVDKINKQITLVVSEVQANSESISSLQLTTDSITASVTEIQETTTSAIDGVNEEIATLTNKVEATMTAEDVTIAIKSEMSNGVTKVETETGFTFNDEGLTVSKSDSEMKTTITEDGMTVYKNEEAVLVADNEGVKAEDLHATTYLIIGKNSRFEDFGDRTACFWIGS